MTTYVKNKWGSIDSIQMMPEEVLALEEAIKALPRFGTMVEWGSGGSTCRWLELLSEDQKLISIEHNFNYYNKVKDSVQRCFGDISHKFCYIPVNISDLYDHGYGGIEEENPFGLEQYINPDIQVYSADLFFIDGIGRGACLASTLLNRTNRESVIFMHDYSLRKLAYSWITQFCVVEEIGSTLAKISFKK